MKPAATVGRRGAFGLMAIGIIFLIDASPMS
jgi:hypothetical protein